MSGQCKNLPDILVQQPFFVLPNDGANNSRQWISWFTILYMPQPENYKPHIITQLKLNDLIRDLTFSIQQNELLHCHHYPCCTEMFKYHHLNYINLHEFFTFENRCLVCIQRFMQRFFFEKHQRLCKCIIENLIKYYQNLEWNTSLKIHLFLEAKDGKC